MTTAEVVRDPYTWAWLAWIVAFFGLEVAANRDRRAGGTLSELVWEAFAVREEHKGWRWRRIALISVLAWLVIHWLTGGWV